MIPCQKRGYLIICISWFIVDIAFELGQKYQPLTIEIIPDWFERILFLENTRNYFLRGTFDFTDLAVTAFGTVIAYLVLLATMERRKMS
jgi:glycopeptide antibiotics resistance protein